MGDNLIANLIRRIRLLQVDQDHLIDRLIVAVVEQENNPQEGRDAQVRPIERPVGVWTVSDFRVGDPVRILNPSRAGQDHGVVIRKTAQRLVIRTPDRNEVYRSANKVVLMQQRNDPE